MIKIRPVDVNADKEILLEFHCCINFESESSWARAISYPKYREKWLSTDQPESFLADLRESMSDPRTIAEIWEEEDATIGYVWATFTEVRDYDLMIAEVNDIAVNQSYRGRGIGTEMLKHIEQLARDRGAHILRSETGIENTSSDRLHMRVGFKPYRIQYEKVLIKRDQ